MDNRIIREMDDRIYNEIDNLIDYYVEMKDYIKHVESKKDKLKKIIIEVLQYKDINSYSTNNVRLKIKKNKLKKNTYKNELIDYIIKYKKIYHIKLVINDKLIDYLKRDESALRTFKNYISKDNREDTVEHEILVKHMKNNHKEEFLLIELFSKNKVLSPGEDKKMAACLEAYKEEENSIKLEARKIGQAI